MVVGESEWWSASEMQECLRTQLMPESLLLAAVPVRLL